MEIAEKQRQSERAGQKRKQNIISFALLSPYLIIFILFTLIPVVMGFVFSFMKYNPYDTTGGNVFIGFQNYANIFDLSMPVSKSFWESFITMLLFDFVAVPCLIIIPLFLAYFINMKPPCYKLFRALIYLPSVVSVSIMGIIFGNMFAGNSSGLINSVFGTDVKWLSGTPFNGDFLRWFVMLIASIWWQTGSNFIIFSGALRDVPKSLYEACEMDGGGRIRSILTVTLPNIKPSLAICLFNILIGYLNLYGQPTVLNEIENENILVSPMMFIQKYLSGMAYARQTGYVCGCAIVFGIFVMIFSMIERKLTAEHRRISKHSAKCAQYLQDAEYCAAAYAQAQKGE